MQQLHRDQHPFTGLGVIEQHDRLQIVAQRHTPATEAALIMSMESVFAALAAAILLGERLTVLAAIGCGLVLLGVIMVEVGPVLPGGRRRAMSTDELPPIGTVPLD